MGATSSTTTDEERTNDIVIGLQYAFQQNSRSTVIPFGFQGIFSVESSMTLPTKVQYYAVPTEEDAQLWVNSLTQARQESITRSRGHSKVPVPQSWQYFDKRQDFEMVAAGIPQYSSSSPSSYNEGGTYT
jgi:hypothetical protein